MNYNTSKDPCTFCGFFEERFDGQDLICVKCGFVRKQNFNSDIELTPCFDTTSSIVDNGKNNFNLPSEKDGGGSYVNTKLLNFLKKSLQKNKRNTTCCRTRIKGLLELQRICKVMQIDSTLQRSTANLFELYNKKGFLKNRNVYSCVAVLLAISAGQLDMPYSLVEILKNSLVSKKKFNTDYFALYHMQQKASPMTARTQTYYRKFVSYVKKWANYEEFMKSLDELVEKLLVFKKVGREGIVQSGTLIYMLLKYYDYPYIDFLLKELLINRLTLKNCWNKLKEKHEFLSKYEVTRN